MQYPWLNQRALATLPEPLKRDLETRAVERFFVEWTLRPKDDGTSPDAGFMQFLPMLYYDAPRESVLWYTVRAMAFADMGHIRNGEDVPFNVKAQRDYGTALLRMRVAVEDRRELGSDRTLAALLLIDSFEV